MDIRRRNIGASIKGTTGGGSSSSGTYTINLNGQWEKTTAVSNPDSSLYDGVYRSSGNYNVSNGVSKMFITIRDCSTFKMYIRSYAESVCDYVMVSQLDVSINGSTSYSNTTLVKAHTCGNQQSGTALTSYTLVEYTGISSGEHTITVVYRKDGSVNSGDDRGYVLLPKLAGDSGGSGGESGGSGDSGESIDINNYLTIVALQDGLTASLSNNACEYCIDGDGNWLSLDAGATTQSVNTGHALSFRGNLTPATNVGIGTFTISKKCNLEGNCMSMLFGDNAANNLSLTEKDYAFCRLFQYCATIKSVSSGFLPATALTQYCYSYMFRDCTSLTTAPALPATALTQYCYSYMFWDCTSLTSAPALPATALADRCYYYMFRDCTSLTTAPALPATTLAEWCYGSMFESCQNLTTAPALPATTLANSCYRNMFYGCTSLTSAPALPATALADRCYQYMFYDCSKLNYIKMLATDISATDCLKYWVNNVASTGTFVKHSNMTSLPTGAAGIPEGWTVVNDGEESGGGNEITFYIDDQAYVTPMTALSNMTWGEFVNSEYTNQNGMFTNFRLSNYGTYNGIKFYHEEAMQDMTLYNDRHYDSIVKDYEVIEDGKTYYAY